MKKNQPYFIYLVIILTVFSMCDVIDPLESEQYHKEVYIVRAFNKVLQ